MHRLLLLGYALLWIAVGSAWGLPMDERSPVWQVESEPRLDCTNAVTLEAWIKVDRLPQSGARIIDRHESGTNNGYLLDTYPGNSLRLITANGAVSFEANLAADHWQHVVGVYDAGAKVQKLYLDGREVAAKTDGAFPPLVNRDLPLRLGADQAGGTRLHGELARAAVYGRALTADEIAARAAAGFDQAPALAETIGDWTLAEPRRAAYRSAVGHLRLTSGADSVELTGQAPPPTERLSAWYRQPAGQWVEATPLGNGRLGAMVYGGVASERIALNEGTFWAGEPYQPGDFDVREPLAKARELVFAGQYQEADKLINEQLLGRPSGQMSYQPIGDLRLSFAGGDQATDYRRELDLTAGLARCTFARDGVRYQREVLASVPDQVLAVRLTAEQAGALNCTVGLRSPQVSEVSLDGLDVVMTGTGPAYRGLNGKARFESRVRVLQDGGSLEPAGQQLRVSGADSCLLLIAIRTNYRSYRDLSGDPHRLAVRDLDAAARRSWDDLRARHVSDYQHLAGRASLDLGGWEAGSKPTDERIKAIAEGAVDPALAALYWQFGRYLLISCSRPGGQAATLQGLWNESTSPPWDSKYTININTEMNYWPAQTANLSECVEPLARMLAEMAESGGVTAKAMFGARGWVCFHNTDGWRATAPIDGPWAYTPTCGAWLALTLWERWLFGGNRAELEQAYPILRDAALFFVDTLVTEPNHGWLVTCPSASPENRHAPGGANACAGPTMDNQILRDLFAAVIEGGRILDRDRDLQATLAQVSAKLPPDQIGRDGQLQEWLEDWDTSPGADLHHRHVSHLYGLYPSAQISPLSTPTLAAAAKKSLDIRGDAATGWSLGWKINLWARLRDGNHAAHMINMLLDPSRTYPNLFDAHPPFQIDGNFGGVSGICEMLLQSHETEGGRPVLDLLPALPTAWPAGAVRGLRARGGYTIDLAWSQGRLLEATLTSDRTQSAQLRYGDRVDSLPLVAGQTVTWQP